MNSLEQSDAEAAAVAVAPRVTLADIEKNIHSRYFFTGGEAAHAFYTEYHDSLEVLTICLLVLKNGFTVIGKSAPADEANFNRDLGERNAYEDAVRQVWPIMGYALRQRRLDAKSALDLPKETA